MAVFINNINVNPSSHICLNNQSAQNVYYNNVLVWSHSLDILSYGHWATVSETRDGAGTLDNYGKAWQNADGSCYLSAFNGGRAGWAHWTFGPFDTTGFHYLNIKIPVSVSPGANGVLIGTFYIGLYRADGSLITWCKYDSPPTIPCTFDGIVAEIGQYTGIYIRVGVQGAATAQGGTTEATIQRLLLQ